MNDLAAGLADAAERCERALRRWLSEPLLELAPRHLDRPFALLDLAFGQRPGALLAPLPEWATGVDQEHFERSVPAPVKQQTCRFLGHASIVRVRLRRRHPALVAPVYPEFVGFDGSTSGPIRTADEPFARDGTTATLVTSRTTPS